MQRESSRLDVHQGLIIKSQPEATTSLVNKESPWHVPDILCHHCGSFRALSPEEPSCSCGYHFLWQGNLLTWDNQADPFYEGRYANRVHFNMARLQKRGGRFLVHFINYGYYESILDFVPPGASVLEVGCAGGAKLLGEWARVTGVDLSYQALELAATSYDRVLRADVRHVDFAPASFDAITSCFFWEHVPPADKHLLLEQFRCWLRPGGKLIQLFDVASENPLFAWARKQPELFQECFIHHDGHIGLEPASVAMERFSKHGFRLLFWRAMNRSPLQHLPVFEWLRPFGHSIRWVRCVSALGAWVSRHKIASRIYTGGVQLFDDSVGRLLPLDWARLLLVVLEK